MRTGTFTKFFQQILSGKLLLVDKKLISMMSTNYNYYQFAI